MDSTVEMKCSGSVEGANSVLISATRNLYVYLWGIWLYLWSLSSRLRVPHAIFDNMRRRNIIHERD